jgi:putative membrane protein
MSKTLIIQAAATALAVLVGARLMPGVRIRRSETALGVAAVFVLLNLLLGWLLKVVLALLLLLPAAIVTLFLPYFLMGWLVNSGLLYLTDKLIDDFEIDGLGSLLGTAALISAAGWLLPRLI